MSAQTNDGSHAETLCLLILQQFRIGISAFSIYFKTPEQILIREETVKKSKLRRMQKLIVHLTIGIIT